ncbi:MAG: 3-dehydroquinate synthase [Eubacteriaceae bacterium]|nr:3-dehydroquinate synthase [Eubacteriaceae bacterium]
MERLTVNTSRKYDVVIGDDILSSAGGLAGKVSPPCKVCIVTDSNVHELFTSAVAESFASAGFDVRKTVFPPGEETKSLKNLGSLLEYLAEEEFTRSDMLIALGGGVIGDLTGFAAAVYLRGIKFIQIPTTLLAAVDASIGGKTAVDLEAGKNLAGAFWQPSMVIIDPKTMGRLPHEIFLDGLAEVIKSGAIANGDLFTYVSRAEEPDFNVFIEHCIIESIKVKKTLVENDEKDTGERQLLNFGHTVGHAIEKCSGYSISHGHAVALGMLVCSRAAAKMKWSRYDCSAPIKNILEKYKYPLDIDFTADELYNAALRDKKRQGDTINLVIPLKMGECALMEIPVTGLREFIEAGLEQ